MKKNTFKPDERNLGGRKLLVDHMYNHRASLDNIKSKIITIENPTQLIKGTKIF